jgi:hypothetical protein
LWRAGFSYYPSLFVPADAPTSKLLVYNLLFTPRIAPTSVVAA